MEERTHRVEFQYEPDGRNFCLWCNQFCSGPFLRPESFGHRKVFFATAGGRLHKFDGWEPKPKPITEPANPFEIPTASFDPEPQQYDGVPCQECSKVILRPGLSLSKYDPATACWCAVPKPVPVSESNSIFDESEESEDAEED